MVMKKIKRVTAPHFERIKTTTSTFKQEFKNQTVIAITAAFGFLIALVWRDWITSIIKTDKVSFFSAVFITTVCVLGLMLISKWASNPEKK
ncbi:MAG: DUF5654 family protein [Nanoarchaeota archaeon]|nr:DUF5654 family protein [Nanoarchaeota archaeon]